MLRKVVRPTGGPHPLGSRRRPWARNQAATDIASRRKSHAFHPGDYHRGFELLEPRQLLSGDLTQEIINLVDGGTTTGSVDLGDDTVGSFLSANSVTVSFENFSQQSDSGWSGKVSVTADTASIAIGQDFTGQILGNGTAGSVGLSGSYILNDQPLGQGSYQLSATDLTASIPNVLSASASNVSLDYDPTGTASQKIATIGSLSAQIIPLNNASVTLSNLDIAENGFSLQNATVSAGSFTLGGFLSVNDSSLSFSDVAYTTGSSLEGTIAIGTGSATLFPNQSAFSASVSGFQGTYDLNTGAFSLSATNASVSIGQILDAQVDGTATDPGLAIAYDPSASIPLTVSAASISLTSPDFPGVSAIATDLQASSAGFSLGDATLTDSSSVELGGFLEADGLSLSVSDLSYSTAPPSGQQAFGGTIAISATSASLFPNQSLFIASVEGFQGSYDLNTSAFALSATSASVTIGQILDAQVSGTEQDPGLSIAYDPGTSDPLAVTANTISLTSPIFPGLSATATDLQASDAGFSLGNATLQDSNSITLGEFLEVSGLEVSVSGLDYQPGEQPAFGGTIIIGATSASLFPKQSLFAASLAGFQGTYDLNTGTLSLSATGASVTIGQILDAEVTGTTTDPGLSIVYDGSNSTYSVSANTISLTSPDFPGLSATATDLQASNTGFTLGNATLSDSSSITLGGVLQVERADDLRERPGLSAQPTQRSTGLRRHDQLRRTLRLALRRPKGFHDHDQRPDRQIVQRSLRQLRPQYPGTGLPARRGGDPGQRTSRRHRR